MVEIAKPSDIKLIAQREILFKDRKLIGLTITQPRYVAIPEEGDPDAVFEFVVDVDLITGITQSIIPGNTADRRRLDNVMVSHEATGDILNDINVPVELELNHFGQLMVVARAKVHLPSLRAQGYSYEELGLGHLAELQEVSPGVWQDAFGIPVASDDPQVFESNVKMFVQTSSTSRLSTLGELGEDDDGVVIGLGFNQLQRTIRKTLRGYDVTAEVSVQVSETESN
jgi:hypothetical protein